jgi:hypothetical protein
MILAGLDQSLYGQNHLRDNLAEEFLTTETQRAQRDAKAVFNHGDAECTERYEYSFYPQRHREHREMRKQFFNHGDAERTERYKYSF